jgi:NAD(P)-dependent dehydrogenase (short-subunit alcohol dehydrogenase family)
MRLNGKKAVVTGGSRGIGAAVAIALAEAGADVVIGARDGNVARQAAARMSGAAGRADAVTAEVLDVTDEKSVARFEQAARARLGDVDVLVNNAGTASSAPVTRLDLAEWRRLLDVNATGTFLVTRAFLPGMLERGRGRIVNVASTAGLEGGKYIAAYAASKHAVLGFTRSVAAEVAGRGITVNAVCPGFVDTDLTRESVERIMDRTGASEADARAQLAAASPGGVLLAPADVARAVLALCGENAGDVNGQAIVVEPST